MGRCVLLLLLGDRPPVLGTVTGQLPSVAANCRRLEANRPRLESLPFQSAPWWTHKTRTLDIFSFSYGHPKSEIQAAGPPGLPYASHERCHRVRYQASDRWDPRGRGRSCWPSCPKRGAPWEITVFGPRARLERIPLHTSESMIILSSPPRRPPVQPRRASCPSSGTAAATFAHLPNCNTHQGPCGRLSASVYHEPLAHPWAAAAAWPHHWQRPAVVCEGRPSRPYLFRGIAHKCRWGERFCAHVLQTTFPEGENIKKGQKCGQKPLWKFF